MGVIPVMFLNLLEKYCREEKPKKSKIKYKTIKIEEEYYEQMIKYYNELRGECDE